MWAQLVEGNKISRRARVIVFNEAVKGLHRCISEIQHRPFLLEADLHAPVEHVAILNGVFKKDHMGIKVVMGFASEVLQLGPITTKSFFSMKELCAGIGGLSKGFRFSGVKTSAVVEKQPKFCAMHPSGSRTAVIEGDISRLSTISRLFRAVPDVDMLGLGFSCQPFSKGGDRRGGYDTRAYTLAWGLFCAYILRAPVICLECVSEAPDHQYVRQCIHAFQQCTGFHASEHILDISSMWPSSRKRWWCVLTTVGKLQLSPMPKLELQPMISDLIPEFPQLEEEDLKALCLQQYEREALQRFRAEDGSWLFRHPAPVEVSLMVGMPLTAKAGQDPRLELAALGQIASPFQSAWIGGLLKDHLLARGIGEVPRELPHAPLRRVVEAMFEQRDSLFASESHTTAMQRFQHNLRSLLEVPTSRDDDDMPMEVVGTNHDGPRTDFVWPALPVEEEEKKDEEEAETSHPQSGPSASQGVPIAGEMEASQPTSTGTIVGAVPGFQWNVQPETGPSNQTQPEATRTDERDPPPTQDSDDLFAEGLRSDTQWQADEMMLGGPDAASLASPMHHEQTEEESSMSPDEEMQVDEADVPQKFMPHTHVVPAQILQKQTVLYNRVHDQVTAFKVEDDMTIADLLKAEFLEEATNMRARSLVGNILSDADLVANWQVIVVRHKDDSTQEDLSLQEVQHVNQHRVRSLMVQGAQVAHDEMHFYLTSLVIPGHSEMVRPLVVPLMMDPSIDSAQWLHELTHEQDKVRVSAILAKGHWSPVLLTTDGIFHTTVEGQAALNMMQITKVETHDTQGVFDHDCGFQTFAWLTYNLARSPHQVMPIDSAASWRFLSWQRMAVMETAEDTTLVFLGGHDDLQTAIATLLREHGVPVEGVIKRADVVISKLGRDKLSQALQSKRPWAQIKQMANVCIPKLQLVLPFKLEQVMKQRTTKVASVGSKDNKAQSSAKPAVSVQVADISIPPGVFVFPDGKPAHQIELRQIQSVGKGLVVCTEQDVIPFLQTDPISQDGLLFLILHLSSSFQEKHGQAIRVPAQCRTTGEPMLVSVVAIQSGTVQVKRNVPSVLTTVPEVKVATLKVFMYKDQVRWGDLTRSPIRYLLDQFPWLASCRKKGCTFPAWHRTAVSDDDPLASEPILDLWGRDYLSNALRRVKPNEADVYVCSIRLRGDLLMKVLQASGQQGVYFEPRSDDGRNPSQEYVTVWLQKLDFSEASAAAAKAMKPAYMLRVAKRYGLKVHKDDAQCVHQQFRGDAPFLGNGQSVVYQIGPLPWGTSRQGLQKLFSSWGWSAVPLQPAGKSACQQGLLWWARATSPPSHAVITMQHGDVIIVKRDAEIAPKQQVPRVEASSLTRSKLAGKAYAVQDIGDPWAESAAKLPGVQTITQSHLDQLESRLTSKIAQTQEAEDWSHVSASWRSKLLSWPQLSNNRQSRRNPCVTRWTPRRKPSSITSTTV
eukprot:Skav229086  [mRNA]  locus=scaffold2711:98137:102653:+ [translate_table: standard]